MILIINVCSDSLHYFEFVKPIEDILEKDFVTKKYNEVSEEDLKNASKVIICGTGLQDNEFRENLENFSWIKNFEKPIFGICAGFQIIGEVFGGKVGSLIEIGYYHENFSKEFLGMKEEQKVYHLHNEYIEWNEEFNIYSRSKIVQAVKHKKKEIYGCLFHPEVRNKEIINGFSEL